MYFSATVCPQLSSFCSKTHNDNCTGWDTIIYVKELLNAERKYIWFRMCCNEDSFILQDNFFTSS